MTTEATLDVVAAGAADEVTTGVVPVPVPVPGHTAGPGTMYVVEVSEVILTETPGSDMLKAPGRLTR